MGVDLRCQVNNQAHRTEEMDQDRLIVRRGQPFSLTLQCSTPPPPGHRLALVLHLGEPISITDRKRKQQRAGMVGRRCSLSIGMVSLQIQEEESDGNEWTVMRVCVFR